MPGSLNIGFHYTTCPHQLQICSHQGVRKNVPHFLTGCLGMVPTRKKIEICLQVWKICSYMTSEQLKFIGRIICLILHLHLALVT